MYIYIYTHTHTDIYTYTHKHTVFPFYFKIYLAVPGLSCGMQDLIPRPGIEPGPPALGAWSLGHWSSREVLVD